MTSSQTPQIMPGGPHIRLSSWAVTAVALGVLGLRGRQAGAPLPPQCISSATHTAGAQETFVGKKRRKDRTVGGAGYSPAGPTQGAPRSPSSPLLSTLGWLSALRLRVVEAGVAPTSPTAPASDARGGAGADKPCSPSAPPGVWPWARGHPYRRLDSLRSCQPASDPPPPSDGCIRVPPAV